MIDKDLIDILACPDCQSDVELKDKELVCKKCKKKYTIKNGVPILLNKRVKK